MTRRAGWSRWVAGERGVVGALGALVVLLFADPVFRGRVFYERDIGLLWHAQTESFVRAVTSGSLPLWDPYTAFGQPMLANANYQVLYPFTWLNLLMRPETYFVVFAVSHAILAAVGQYLLARRLDMSPPGAWVAAALFVASGPFLSLVNTWNHFAAAGLIPWALLATWRALDEPGWRRSVLWGLPLGLQVLAGSPDLAVFTGVLAAAATAARFDWRKPQSSVNRGLAGTAALALAFALALSAGQWLPSLDAASRSARRHVAPHIAAAGSLHPILGTAKLFSPVPLADLPLRKPVAGPLLDGGMVLLRLPYLGLAAGGLVLAAFLAPPRRGRRFLVVLAVVAFLYALGARGLIHSVATTAIPMLRGLRYPSKALVLVAFAWALLAGMGFEYWRSAASATRRHWRLVVGAPLLGTAALAAAAWWELRSPQLLAPYLVPEDPRLPWRDGLGKPAAHMAVAGGLTTLLAVVAFLRRARPGTAGLGAALAAAVAVADLGVATRDVNRTTRRSFYGFRPALVDEVGRGDFARVFVYRYNPALPLRSVQNPYQVAWHPGELDLEAARVLGARMYPLPPVAGTWGLFGSYDPDLVALYPAHLTEIVRWAYEAHGTPAFRRYLELGAVRHAVGLDPQGFGDLEPVKELKTPLVLPARLYHVASALPRTYAVPSARIVAEADARGWLEAPEFDPRREVLLVDAQAGAGAPRGSAPAGTSRISVFKPDFVRLEAEMVQPGYVVLVDTWDPGWTARVDGRPTAVWRANAAFRAVAVPAGRHVVEMSYRPPWLLIGLATSASAVGLLVAAVKR